MVGKSYITGRQLRINRTDPPSARFPKKQREMKEHWQGTRNTRQRVEGQREMVNTE